MKKEIKKLLIAMFGAAFLLAITILCTIFPAFRIIAMFLLLTLLIYVLLKYNEHEDLK